MQKKILWISHDLMLASSLQVNSKKDSNYIKCFIYSTPFMADNLVFFRNNRCNSFHSCSFKS